ncbi:uncharacterized protein LOC112876567 [Panicum hallii]|uniref:uncharacterized protein LOC112876567 n=1 Tax=Panicum hallii TaxID=206008 RepID=UPI000DF4E49B|nr:uncharacterized protein LOC112876567 [Panicum hallii]
MSSRPPTHPSRRSPRRFPAAYSLLLTLALLFASATAKSSRRPISDNEIRQKKEACYTDVENGLWGWVCRSSDGEGECVLRCLPECYDSSTAGPVSGGVRSAFPRLLFAGGAFLADFCLGLLCSLKKGSWIMSAARSTSTACTNHPLEKAWMA